MTQAEFPRVAVLGVHAGRVPAGTETLLAGAALVAGGREVLERLAPDGAEHAVLGADLEPALARLAAAREVDAVVLASGDPGFFGIVRRLADRLGPERLEVHPAPSCVALAFARLGMPWDDALVVSAHGRPPWVALHAARRHPKVAILTGPAAPPAFFARGLRGTGRRMAIAERLGAPDERVTSGTPEELAEAVFAEPNVVVTWNAAPAERATAWPPRTPPGWALPETAFEHRAGMVTKAEVRALCLAWLGPGVGDLVWDVGCGSGSVAVECARLGADVIALDHDAEAVALTCRNAAAHGVALQALHAAAPAALHELPEPDAVFVGGGGADLGEILELCSTRARRVVVVTLALLDRVAPILERLSDAGFAVEATQLQASRLKPLAGGHRLAAENPVFVLAGRR